MLELEVEGDPARGTLSLAGRLDERADLGAVAARVPEGGTLEVDLGGLMHINSVGVRAWIGFLRTLRGRGVAVRLARCSETIVRQMNMIIEARGGAAVVSFFAPYECNACEREEANLLDCARDREALAAGALPEASCSECGGAMAFSGIPERYLLFLR